MFHSLHIIAHNGRRYEMLGISEHFTVNQAETLIEAQSLI